MTISVHFFKVSCQCPALAFASFPRAHSSVGTSLLSRNAPSCTFVSWCEKSTTHIDGDKSRTIIFWTSGNDVAW